MLFISVEDTNVTLSDDVCVFGSSVGVLRGHSCIHSTFEYGITNMYIYSDL